MPRVPRSGMFNFDFPEKSTVKELQSKGDLKKNSKVKISGGKWLLVYWRNHGYWQNMFIAIILGLIAQTITDLYFDDKWFVWMGYGITYVISYLILELWLSKTKSEFLGYISEPDTLKEFLDKFGLGLWEKILIKSFKMITLGKVTLHLNWNIEFELLLQAYRMSRENPQALNNAAKKAKNKKEFRWLAGIS